MAVLPGDRGCDAQSRRDRLGCSSITLFPRRGGSYLETFLSGADEVSRSLSREALSQSTPGVSERTINLRGRRSAGTVRSSLAVTTEHYGASIRNAHPEIEYFSAVTWRLLRHKFGLTGSSELGAQGTLLGGVTHYKGLRGATESSDLKCGCASIQRDAHQLTMLLVPGVPARHRGCP